VRLDTPLTRVLGPPTARAFASKLGLTTVGDLLHHYPFRYAKRGDYSPLRDLREGDHVTISGRVLRSAFRQTAGGKFITEILVTDGTGKIVLTFFSKNINLAKWQAGRVPEGTESLFAGTVNRFNTTLQLLHPEVLGDEDAAGFAGQLIPIYKAASKLPTWNIAKAMAVVLDTVELDDDPLPADLRERFHLPPWREALLAVHRPESEEQANAAKERLKWDEAFILQVVLAQRRKALELQGGVPRGGTLGGLRDAFDQQMPWQLTDGQLEIGKLLESELARTHPMHRLLQGEVGSGKTVVALRAMLAVVDSGGQAALLAPTEVLAQQHLHSLRDLLGPLAMAGQLGGSDVATRVTLLTGSVQAAARRQALHEIASGEAGIVVGTHALMSEGVEFQDLGLVVVDEQHRFGVEQREALRAKGSHPHLLVMTATPIPRTVAMTVFGDLEVSTLRELPRGRSPISTEVVRTRSDGFRAAMDAVLAQVSQGRQAFVVCPRIGDEEAKPTEADRRPALAVLDVVDVLRDHYLPAVRLDVLHGRMSSEAKEEAMARFAGGDTDVLVSTTVIEVGVDVANATVMVIMDADRFGISQLHQLRGRVGRGQHAGHCYLATELPLDSVPGERLAAVAATSDGFALSELDLRVRQEGDVLGTEQSGSRTSLRFLALDDVQVIQQTRVAATDLVAEDPELANLPSLRTAVDALLDDEHKAFIEKA
jgi:ATP-dependent DNA helicase RecG